MNNPGFAPPQGPPPAYQPRQIAPEPRREAWQTSESQNVSNQQRTNQQNYAGQPAGKQGSMCSGKTICVTLLGILAALAMMALTIGLGVGLSKAGQGISNAIGNRRTGACQPRQHFQCSNGQCVSLHWNCDGEDDCGDGSDERNCVCDTKTQYMCKEGRTCISKKSLCDGRDDCPISPTLGAADDELSCSCTPSQTACASGLCISLNFWCDGIKDCRDGSDELAGCENSCPNDGIRCPTSGFCMNKAQFCDHISDCSTELDEQNCGCKPSEYQCSDKRCISNLWICDGTSDCVSGEDEASCSQCPPSQFQCKYTAKACVLAEQQCDGVNQCTDTSDESGCVTNTGNSAYNAQNAVRVNYKGTSGVYVCYDNWNNNLNDKICKQMGYNTASAATGLALPSTGSYVALIPGRTASSSSNIMSFLQPTSSCTSGRILGLVCTPAECGIRMPSSTNFGPYVVNGQQAVRGAWPWQVLIVYDKSMTCGGTIISNTMILTAAHCAEKYTNIALLSVRAGSIYNEAADYDAKQLQVDKSFVHPDYGLVAARNVFLNDVAILHLRSPITFTDTIKPICLPSPSVNLQQFKVCVATGFGNTRSDAGDVSQYLIQGKMQLMSEDACRRAYSELTNSVWKASSADFTKFVCAGNSPSANGVDTCQGDSGGPLACRDQNDIWQLVGVTSFGFVKCQLSVFAKVSSYLPFVDAVKANYAG